MEAKGKGQPESAERKEALEVVEELIKDLMEKRIDLSWEPEAIVAQVSISPRLLCESDELTFPSRTMHPGTCRRILKTRRMKPNAQLAKLGPCVSAKRKRLVMRGSTTTKRRSTL